MAYRMAAIPMTLSDLQSHSAIASLFICFFSYICAAVDKILADTTLCAVVLR